MQHHLVVTGKQSFGRQFKFVWKRQTLIYVVQRADNYGIWIYLQEIFRYTYYCQIKQSLTKMDNIDVVLLVMKTGIILIEEKFDCLKLTSAFYKQKSLNLYIYYSLTIKHCYFSIIIFFIIYILIEYTASLLHCRNSPVIVSQY